MTRTETRTERIATEFGPIYFHVDHLGSKVMRVYFSAPQKLEDSQIWRLLESIMHSMNRLIKPVSEMNDEERIQQVREILRVEGPK